jgi:hypothetical protein
VVGDGEPGRQTWSECFKESCILNPTAMCKTQVHRTKLYWLPWNLNNSILGDKAGGYLRGGMGIDFPRLIL